MEYNLNTRLNGSVVATSELHRNKSLLQDKSLYKFVWVCKGHLLVEIDHVPMKLQAGDMISLSPLHHLRFLEVDGEYQTLLFNSNFYCIFGHDSEVSCNGFLFNGSSHVMLLKLDEEQSRKLNNIFNNFIEECDAKDNLQEEMLRIILKQFIITCTRIARSKFSVDKENERSFDIVRQFYVLVDTHFKEKKQVQDYAELLFRSPKTISNLFSEYGLPSPLKVIHDRVVSEAKRLLLYTNKSAKEIGVILGFEDIATFSRFFKKMAKESISEYRKRGKQE